MGGGLGVTVLPDTNPMGDAVARMFDEFNRRKSEDSMRKQQQSQFDTSLAEQKRLNDAAISQHQSAAGLNEANTRSTDYQTLAARAKTVSDSIMKTADQLAASGDHEKAAQFVVSALQNLDGVLEKSRGTKFEGDAATVRQLVGESLLGTFVGRPDTNVDVTKRNAAQWTADATGRAAAGGQGAIDVNAAMKVGTGEQLSAPSFGNQQQREMGPKALEQSVAIAGGRAPSAGDTLQAQTSRQNQESSNATAVKIAGMNADAREAAATAKANAANGGASSPEAIKFKNEAIRLAKELLNDPGLSSAVGTTVNPSHGFGYKDSNNPISGTEAADFAVRAKRLAGLLSVESLKSKFLPGQMSDSDREMIIGLSSTLGNLGQKESSYRNELSRIIAQNDNGGTPNVIRYDANGNRVQ